MKTAIVFALCFAAVLAVPVDNTPSVTVVKDEKDVRVDGYKFGFETSDGSKREEEAELKPVGTESALTIRGSYEYVAPDGQIISVKYIADENGYQPDNIPKA